MWNIGLDDLLNSGGPVLWLILLISLLLWALIIERYFYLLTQHKQNVGKIVENWQQRSERNSWYAEKIRTAAISQVKLKLQKSQSMIRTIIVICPMLGILGTVTGMIAVFDVITFMGSSNARAMASGISMATIPTMAGMVVALSGLYFELDLRQRTTRETDRITDLLVTE